MNQRLRKAALPAAHLKPDACAPNRPKVRADCSAASASVGTGCLVLITQAPVGLSFDLAVFERQRMRRGQFVNSLVDRERRGNVIK